jgi:hypothetical protein
MKYVKRIIALPFVIGFTTVHFVSVLLKISRNWILYGGEAVTYEKDDKATIYDIYKELKKQHEN